MAKHIYVIDTCVLLHDPHAIYKFEENDIYIPLAVIDDLDEIKTKRDTAAWSAREVLRQINLFPINELTRGVKINPQNGKMWIYNSQAPLSRGEQLVITRLNSDNVLIETCIQLKAQFPKRKVCLVTKDVGLMVRAASFSVLTENYKNDMIDAKLYKGFQMVNVDSKKFIDDLYINEKIHINEAKKYFTNDVYQNEFIIFEYDKSNVITILKGEYLYVCLHKKNKQSFMGISPKNLEQKLSVCLLNDETIPLVCLAGKAGTGKSINTLAVGLQKIKEGVYDRLVVVKPMVPVGGKEIGFLPGDKFSKIVAWLGPIKDNIDQLINFDPDMKKDSATYFEEMCDKGIIEVEAMTFIQGRSITNAFIMLEEAENVSPREARMFVERCGNNSKVVLLGDLSQIENPYLDQYSCGLTHAIQGGKDSVLVGSMVLNKVERSALADAASEIFIKGLVGA